MSLTHAQSHAGQCFSACRFLHKKNKKRQTVYKIRPLVEYAAFFWDLWQKVINQIEMFQHRTVRYIFNNYNLCRNRQANESQCDTSMTNIFMRPVKTPDSWHTFLDLITKFAIRL